MNELISAILSSVISLRVNQVSNMANTAKFKFQLKTTKAI